MKGDTVRSTQAPECPGLDAKDEVESMEEFFGDGSADCSGRCLQIDEWTSLSAILDDAGGVVYRYQGSERTVEAPDIREETGFEMEVSGDEIGFLRSVSGKAGNALREHLRRAPRCEPRETSQPKSMAVSVDSLCEEARLRILKTNPFRLTLQHGKRMSPKRSFSFLSRRRRARGQSLPGETLTSIARYSISNVRSCLDFVDDE